MPKLENIQFTTPEPQVIASLQSMTEGGASFFRPELAAVLSAPEGAVTLGPDLYVFPEGDPQDPNMDVIHRATVAIMGLLRVNLSSNPSKTGIRPGLHLEPRQSNGREVSFLAIGATGPQHIATRPHSAERHTGLIDPTLLSREIDRAVQETNAELLALGSLFCLPERQS